VAGSEDGLEMLHGGGGERPDWVAKHGAISWRRMRVSVIAAAAVAGRVGV